MRFARASVIDHPARQSTFALLCERVNCASLIVEGATARTAGTLLAAMHMPCAVPQHMIPLASEFSETSRETLMAKSG